MTPSPANTPSASPREEEGGVDGGGEVNDGVSHVMGRLWVEQAGPVLRHLSEQLGALAEDKGWSACVAEEMVSGR